MSYQEEKEERLLNERYPEGSVERKVLEFSRSKHVHDDVPPMLVEAFKVLMGITIAMAFVSLVAFLSTV